MRTGVSSQYSRETALNSYLDSSIAFSRRNEKSESWFSYTAIPIVQRRNMSFSKAHNMSCGSTFRSPCLLSPRASTSWRPRRTTELGGPCPLEPACGSNLDCPWFLPRDPRVASLAVAIVALTGQLGRHPERCKRNPSSASARSRQQGRENMLWNSSGIFSFTPSSLGMSARS